MMTRQAGFTLIEMLVALALTALLALGIGQATGTVAKAWRAVSAPIGADPAVVTAFLRRQIAGALPLAPDAAGMVGTLDRLEFLGGAPAAALPPRLHRQRIELRRGKLGGELWYVWTAAEARLPRERLLVRGVRAMTFAYAGGNGVWQPSWSEAASLPEFVRLSLKVGDEDWPNLVVAPMVDWPVLDTISQP